MDVISNFYPNWKRYYFLHGIDTLSPKINLPFISSLQSRQPYRVCSALLPIKDELSTTLFAKATFDEGSVGGAIYFVSLLALLDFLNA